MIKTNTHFAIATHLLAAMAVNPGQLLSSKMLSETVPTNPAFLRVVLGRLRDGGLIRAVRGKAGGSTLARDPEAITLLDVYEAVGAESGLTFHDCSKSECRLAANIPAFLDRLGERVDAAIAAELRRISIAQLADEVCPTPPGPEPQRQQPLSAVETKPDNSMR